MKINDLGTETRNPKTGKKYSISFKKQTVQYFLSGTYTPLKIRKKNTMYAQNCLKNGELGIQAN